EVNAQYTPIAQVQELVNWVETAGELSNDALLRAAEAAAQKGGDAGTCLQKALHWSRAVNAAIAALPEEDKRPFDGAAEGLAAAHRFADVAVVSSANRDAVLEEWSRYGLLSQVDLVLAQDAGSKAHCIARLLQKGYDPQRVLMVGDAPGDRDAAQKNGVQYYPILVRNEAQSWRELVQTALPLLQSGEYAAYGAQKTEEFLRNLGG
ncbi:MAG: HAD hydrolase-like protein, partial [Ruthenibacterium sp.]